MSKPSRLRALFSAIWSGITRIRLALSNILFLVVIAVLLFFFFGGGSEPIPERAALLLNLRGVVVDQKSQVEPLEALLGEPSLENSGRPPPAAIKRKLSGSMVGTSTPARNCS